METLNLTVKNSFDNTNNICMNGQSAAKTLSFNKGKVQRPSFIGVDLSKSKWWISIDNMDSVAHPLS